MAGLKPELWAKVRHAETRTFSQWHVTLACGHAGMISAPHDWKPEDGITRRPAPDPDPKRAERRQGILAGLFGEDLRHDAAEGYPEPKPWKECLLCAIGRRIVAYEYVAALADRPPWKPAKPPTPAEQKAALQRQLDDADRKAKAAERKAAKLRQELAQLDDAGG